MSKQQIAIGVDGCRGGWFFVRWRAGTADFGITADLRELFNGCSSARIAIDMPIGLRERRGGMRHCDRDARRLLGAKRASVFSPPLRGALKKQTHARASAWQKERCGKGLSIQSFNIAPKIAEVDALLRASLAARSALFEAHPELCFYALNDAAPVLASKKTDAGAGFRMRLLQAVIPEASDILNQALERYRRKDVARDDIVDALVLLHVARTPPERTQSIPLAAETDAKGLDMKMTFAAEPTVQEKIRSRLAPESTPATAR